MDLYDCNGTGAQVWVPQSNHKLVNPQSGKCLDDTGFGGSGTPVQIWSCADTSNQQWTLPTSSGGGGSTPNFGPNVLVFNPSMSSSTIQSQINSVYSTQQSNQFGTPRYALLFTPGTYNVDVPVGFYTQVLGLGQSLAQTTITGGGVHADANWNGGNATINFWRDAENLTSQPSTGSTVWATSQATPAAPDEHHRLTGAVPQRLFLRWLHRRLGGHRPGQLRQPAAVPAAQRPAGQLDRRELEHGVRRRHRRAGAER